MLHHLSAHGGPHSRISEYFGNYGLGLPGNYHATKIKDDFQSAIGETLDVNRKSETDQNRNISRR